MQFSGKTIPGSLFQLARERLLAEATSTPEAVRQYMLHGGANELQAISDSTTNQWLVCNRVMRASILELVAAGELVALKRGVWVPTKFLKAAEPKAPA